MSDSGSLFGDVHKPSARTIYEHRKKYSNFIVADVSQYAVNHLVTFSIGEEDDLTCVEDAVRKLCIMDKQGKVWVQEMLLQVSGSAIKLLDINSKEELENYALATVAYCDAVCPESRSRSLLLLMCQEPTQLRPDIHFFECDQIRAEWIQQDISSALLDFNTGGNTQRAEALRAAQNMLDNQEISRPPVQVPSRTKIVAPGPREDAMLVGESDLTSIQMEQNVELLNHVFDDVEAFVRNLQKSAEAFRVLNQCRRSARRHLREPGEGLLTIRAKPPSQEEFEDTLSKIKYSFSLLARLKSNITNPTSEELLCILFKPLKMIVDASGGVEFASELRNPMLTLEAVTLMRSCLGEQETEFWHSLGENWTKPRVDFPRGYAAPYNLTFCSGWEPPVRDAFGKPWEDPVEIQHRHEERRTQQSAPTIAANGCKHLEKSVICTHSFTARNSNELSVLQGDILEVLDDSRKWWKVKNCYDQVGYVPYNILAPVLNGDNSSIQNDKEMLLIHEITPVTTKITPPQPPAMTTSLQSNGVKLGSAKEPNENQNKKEHFSVVNEELVFRLANGTSGYGKTLHIPRTLDTDVPLDYNSNSDQVRTWLEAKGFNPLNKNQIKSFRFLISQKGEPIPARGYWGDITTGPYITFGIEAEDPSLLKTINGRPSKDAQEISLQNVTALLYELRYNTHYDPSAPSEEGKDDHLQGDGDCTVLCATKGLPVTEEVRVHFLPLDCLPELHHKVKYQQLFNLFFFSCSMVHYLKPNLSLVSAPKATLIVELTNFLPDLRKEQVSEFSSRVTRLATDAGFVPVETDKKPFSLFQLGDQEIEDNPHEIMPPEMAVPGP